MVWLLSNTISFNPQHMALYMICSTEAGMVIALRLSQSAKVLYFIFFILLGRRTFESELQPSKAESPISVTVSGILTVFISVLPLNAPESIFVMYSGMSMSSSCPAYFTRISLLQRKISPVRTGAAFSSVFSSSSFIISIFSPQCPQYQLSRLFSAKRSALHYGQTIWIKSLSSMSCQYLLCI